MSTRDSKPKRNTISTVVNKKPIPKKLPDSHNRKRNQSPETRDNSESDDEDNEEEESDDDKEEEVMDALEYKKLLAKIFPSKYSRQVVKQGENLKNTILSKSGKVNKKQKENEELILKLKTPIGKFNKYINSNDINDNSNPFFKRIRRFFSTPNETEMTEIKRRNANENENEEKYP